jgi:flagellar L-ring protein precursor FlgH
MCKGKVCIMLMVLGMSANSLAQSLIDVDRYRGLTGDQRAYQVGESLTVLVVESTSAESSAGTGADSQTNISARARSDERTYQAGIGLQGDTNGVGQTTRRGQVRANVSVRIIERTSEGLLRVAGEQSLTVNDEKQQIRIAGLVRPDDINYDNTVLSYRLADAEIDIIGDGVVTDAQKQNVVFRVLKWMRLI